MWLRALGSEGMIVFVCACSDRGDGRVSFGFSLLRGKRMTMEDFYDAQVGEGGQLEASFLACLLNCKGMVGSRERGLVR